jgi:homocysteine S-methyltransferase
MTREIPFQPFLEQQGCLILDGGLATELEYAGYRLEDSLWSARLLKEAPQAIAKVHSNYLEAGADCIISASYQATVEGFKSQGASEAEGQAWILDAVQIAVQERDSFWAETSNRKGRLKPLVAASVGPYGAYLANGAEFTGDYDLDEQGLVRFHRRRWEILCESDADLLACETIPSVAEARALATLLSETPRAKAWFSFSCRDGKHISDGTEIVLCVEELESVSGVVAVGINCTAPRHVLSLVTAVRAVTDRAIVVYPNSGEVYDAQTKDWSGTAAPDELASASRGWFEAGARLLGGCCRTRPDHIRQIRSALLM